MNNFSEQIDNLIEKNRDTLVKVSETILNNPEDGHMEFIAVKTQCEYLESLGFKMSANFGGLKTAFAATAGSGSPKIAIFSEYDALPELGHACGHHLIALSALAAATAIKEILEKNNIPGTVTLIGSPAEEALGGKIDLITAGALNDIDFALITHPFQSTNVDPGNLAVSRYDVRFHGKAAHASVAPEEGINALDAQILFFNGIALWRQQMPDSARVHGTVTSGGAMPNIIPDYTASFFYLRSCDNATQTKLESRFEQIAEGAAMMTGCKLELNKYPNSYAANVHSPELEQLLCECAKNSGFELSRITQKISTDFANVSLLCPSANLMFDVVGDHTVAPLHSICFLEYAKKPFAFTQALRAGKAMAKTALRLFCDKTTAQKINAEFDGNF